MKARYHMVEPWWEVNLRALIYTIGVLESRVGGCFFLDPTRALRTGTLQRPSARFLMTPNLDKKMKAKASWRVSKKCP